MEWERNCGPAAAVETGDVRTGVWVRDTGCVSGGGAAVCGGEVGGWSGGEGVGEES